MKSTNPRINLYFALVPLSSGTIIKSQNLTEEKINPKNTLPLYIQRHKNPHEIK